ncbi:hypothetical protein NDU88_004925 [Pleurodeles waltl]|uniref:MHC class II antigen n=1 Tax=Pleurodeles waltl TaxID=8319 RepID=A0AAV7WAE1_PLEWA|nr:hypothetical protein NDU88_004925 [Pleurodeles waltl]
MPKHIIRQSVEFFDIHGKTSNNVADIYGSFRTTGGEYFELETRAYCTDFVSEKQTDLSSITTMVAEVEDPEMRPVEAYW